jgi:squalene cyclase
VQGLVVAGRTYENSSSIRKACRFLLSKQLITGGWGETYPSNGTAVILNFPYLTMCLLGHFMFDIS